LGTIIRCADWFGISDIVCSESCADAFSPKVVQASMGSVARVRIHYVELEAHLRRFADWPVYTAELSGKPVSAIGKIRKGILLIGNESKGIQPSLLASVRHTSITIPKKGDAESLNAAVATAILLSHLT
jgi:TrmH family RNA methyltransferase